jgi:2-polyprenyl-3-methyl-5-hydroxy-6-metoxy-1,4-benzoquinol methylase
MPLGPLVRKWLGPLEQPAAAAYRSLFVDLHSLVGQIEAWLPVAGIQNILDVGCGEGMLVEYLAKAYPNAQITGIDITPRIGRLFKGDRKLVTFRQQTISEFAAHSPCSMDFLIISDVLHHAPLHSHQEIISFAKSALKQDGYFILKEWEQNTTPIHLIAYLADRCITGDRVVYRTRDELCGLVRNVFGMASIKHEARIGPWKNNVVILATKV